MSITIGSGAHAYVTTSKWNSFIIKVASPEIIAKEAVFYSQLHKTGITPICYGAFHLKDPSILALKKAAVLILEQGLPVKTQ